MRWLLKARGFQDRELRPLMEVEADTRDDALDLIRQSAHRYVLSFSTSDVVLEPSREEGGA